MTALAELPAGRLEISYRAVRLVGFSPTSPKVFNAVLQQLQAALEPILLAANNQGQKVAEALGLPLYTAHPLLLRTMLRAELGLLLLKDGQVMGKWHFNDIQRTKDPRHLFCYK